MYHHSSRRARRLAAVTTAVGVVAAVLAGCTPSGSDGEEVVITCFGCQEGEDAFLQYDFDAAQRFNQAFAGRYRVETLESQNAVSGTERITYLQKLALADDLPDVMLVNKQEMIQLRESADLVDFAAALDADPDWRDAYYPDSLASLAVDDGQFGLPEVRDVVGIYYNTALFEAAGIGGFPATWDEFEDDCDALVASGALCFAMDGNWVTLLMWANLIGTSPDGDGFLQGGIAADDWADDPAVIAATERLRSWHEKGYVNSDSLSGDYATAATVYTTGQAAMIANGPWMVPEFRADGVAPGLYEATAYAPSPGWTADGRGILSITGGAWISGSTGDAEKEAAAAFLKFLASPEEAFAQTLATGSYPAVQSQPTEEQKAELEPMVAGLVAEAAPLERSYPNVFENGAATFSTVWLNLWPAYINGDLGTDDFLTQLTDGLASS
jgi:ABC-type glycerol-3-phosphate transport system substrate-binding protein